jgi:integrase/recombinase XerD
MSEAEPKRDPQTLYGHYLTTLEALGFSPQTVKVYRSDLKKFVRWLKEHHIDNLSEVGRRELLEYCESLVWQETSKGKPWSASTRNRHLSTLRSFFRHLVKSGFLLSNPASELKGFRHEKTLPRARSQEDVLRLLAAPDVTTPEGLRDRTMFELFYSCAVRLSELVNLDLIDIDLSEETLWVRSGKYGKDRVLPLLSESIRLLREYLRSRSAFAPEPECPALFLSSKGERLMQNAIWCSFHRYSKKAKLKPVITAHILRHSCATHLLKNRADLRHIQLLLGHSSLSTTQLYTKVEISDLKAVVKRCHPREQF